MADTYKEFLKAPAASLLADNAALHYVPTTTTFVGAEDIVKHLAALQRQVAKKQEEVLQIVEGSDSLVYEASTALEFLTSGGVYLPGLEDNFLSDRIAYLSIIHIVAFDATGKISQIRLHWDQGALLKQLDVISKTGRNWPIKDSRDQLKLIESSLKGAGKLIPTSTSHNELVVHARQKSTNILRDPHATLQLFGNREELEAAQAAESVKAPKAGNRPQQRDFAEILGDNPQDQTTDAPFHRPVSPTKIGQGKNHQGMRLFEGSETDALPDQPLVNPERLIRPHPGKYNHFEFADGSDPQDAPKPGVDLDKREKSKHDSQWSFDDFTTPHRAGPTRGMRSQDLRHWDPETLNEPAEKELPLGRARRDAEAHFELQDDGERPADEELPNRPPRGVGHNEGLGLYKNQIFDKGDPAAGPERALGNITNLKDRGKDFDAHFTMTDNSPSGSKVVQNVTETRQKVVKMMDHNWEVYEQSPLKENQPKPSTSNAALGIMHIAGDGMGGKKGSNRNWLYGDDDEANKPAPRNAQPTGGKQSFWDF